MALAKEAAKFVVEGCLALELRVMGEGIELSEEGCLEVALAFLPIARMIGSKIKIPRPTVFLGSSEQSCHWLAHWLAHSLCPMFNRQRRTESCGGVDQEAVFKALLTHASLTKKSGTKLARPLLAGKLNSSERKEGRNLSTDSLD